MMNSNGPRGSCRRPGTRTVALVLGLAGLLGPFERGHAQWVEESGNGWITLAFYHQSTGERFGINGDVVALLSDGRSVATSSFMTTALGLGGGVDLWTQVSFHRLRYTDSAGEHSSTGIGDTKLWLRAAPLKWLGSDLPFAIRAGFKIPLGDFDVGANEIPLGDGQRDWEVIAELGHSFWPRSVYVSGWVGHRWREENAETGRDFENELFYYAQLGGRVGRVGYRVAVDGWNGAPGGAGDDVANPAFERDLVQILSGLQYDVGGGQVEAGVRFALGGRNATAGRSFVFRFFRGW